MYFSNSSLLFQKHTPDLCRCNYLQTGHQAIKTCFGFPLDAAWLVVFSGQLIHSASRPTHLTSTCSFFHVLCLCSSSRPFERLICSASQFDSVSLRHRRRAPSLFSSEVPHMKCSSKNMLTSHLPVISKH